MLGIQFNRSWNQISHIMNSTFNEKTDQSVIHNSPLLKDKIEENSDHESFDQMNNDVFTLKPSHEFLKNRVNTRPNNNITSTIKSESDDSLIEEGNGMISFNEQSFEQNDSSVSIIIAESIEKSMRYIDEKFNSVVIFLLKIVTLL